MNVVSIVIIVLLAVFSIVGLIVGLCKGFSHVKSWGVEYFACFTAYDWYRRRGF